MGAAADGRRYRGRGRHRRGTGTEPPLPLGDGVYIGDGVGSTSRIRRRPRVARWRRVVAGTTSGCLEVVKASCSSLRARACELDGQARRRVEEGVLARGAICGHRSMLMTLG